MDCRSLREVPSQLRAVGMMVGSKKRFRNVAACASQVWGPSNEKLLSIRQKETLVSTPAATLRRVQNRALRKKKKRTR